MAVQIDKASLIEAGEELLDSIDEFVQQLHRAGGRDSADSSVRYFAAYHLADLEGNDNGGGWLASRLMADDLRTLLRGGDEDEDEEADDDD